MERNIPTSYFKEFLYKLFYIKIWLDDVNHEMYKFVVTYIHVYNICCTWKTIFIFEKKIVPLFKWSFDKYNDMF